MLQELRLLDICPVRFVLQRTPSKRSAEAVVISEAINRHFYLMHFICMRMVKDAWHAVLANSAIYVYSLPALLS